MSDFASLQEQMRAELDALVNKKKGGDKKDDKPNYWFRPVEGKNTVRIVPTKGQPLPFIKLLFHFGINGKNSVLSPRNDGLPDPIADFGDRLIKDGGGKLSKEEFKVIKKTFNPELRTYVPIIVRGKEDEGIKFWAFGEPVYKALLSIYTEKDEDTGESVYGMIHDPETGFDITFDYTPKEKSDTNYAKTENVKPKRNPSVLSKDEAQLTAWIENQPVLKDQFKHWTFEELTEELRQHLEVQTKRGPAPAKENATPTAAPEAPKAASATPTPDVEEEFAKIFNS